MPSFPSHLESQNEKAVRRGGALIGKKLTAVSCSFAGVKPAEKNDGSNGFTLRNMSFEKGTFTVHLHPDLANIGDNAKATFEKALN